MRRIVRSPNWLLGKRYYYYKIDKNLVPQGECTSRFQSSSVPSERDEVIREYALSPLFGHRTSAILLGSRLPPEHFYRFKPRLQEVLEDILELTPGAITLGESRWLSNSALPRHLTPQYQRVDHVTGEVLANTLVGVYLPLDVALEDVFEHGVRIAEAFCGERPDKRLAKECAVSYCEFEIPDLNQHRFLSYQGKEIDAEEVEAIEQRWLDRIAEQQAIWEMKYGDRVG